MAQATRAAGELSPLPGGRASGEWDQLFDGQYAIVNQAERIKLPGYWWVQCMPIGKLSWRGRAPVDAKNWRSKLLAEVGRELDPARVHFVGKLPYEDYLSLLQVSTVHVYLTYPFVLSWSPRARRRLKR